MENISAYIIGVAFTVFFAYLWQMFEEKNTICSRMSRVKIIFCKFLTVMPLYLMNATMYYVGTDYVEYYKYFSQLNENSTWHMDFLFELMCKFLKYNGFDFQWIYVIMCLIGYGLLMVCISKYSKNYAESYFWYFAFSFMNILSFTLIRQFIATMIVWYAIQYIPQKRFIRYVCLVVVAAGFHMTALIMIPFYFVFDKNIRASIWTVLTCLVLPINFFYSDILTWLFKTFKPSYLNSNYVTKDLELDVPYIVCYLFVALIIILYYRKIKPVETNSINGEVGSYNRIFYNSIFCGIFLILFCMWLPIFNRFALYFFVPCIWILPNIFKNESRKSVKIALFLVQAILCFIYMYRYLPHWNVIPYRSMIFNVFS